MDIYSCNTGACENVNYVLGGMVIIVFTDRDGGNV